MLRGLTRERTSEPTVTAADRSKIADDGARVVVV